MSNQQTDVAGFTLSLTNGVLTVADHMGGGETLTVVTSPEDATAQVAQYIRNTAYAAAEDLVAQLDWDQN